MRNDKWIAFAHNLRYSDSVRQSDVRSSTDDGSTQVKAAFRVHRGADKERNIPSAKAHTLTRNLSQHAGIALQRSIHKNPDCPVRKWSTGTGQRRLAGRGLKPLSYLPLRQFSCSHPEALLCWERSVFSLYFDCTARWTMENCPATKVDYVIFIPKNHQETYCTFGAIR